MEDIMDMLFWLDRKGVIDKLDNQKADHQTNYTDKTMDKNELPHTNSSTNSPCPKPRCNINDPLKAKN